MDRRINNKLDVVSPNKLNRRPNEYPTQGKGLASKFELVTY